MRAGEVRNTFVKFFEEKKHLFIPSAPLVPQGDPTLLFVNAGMNQFKDYFLGLAEPKSKRAANYQKCLRVSGKHNDLEDVGQDTYHHTFFEMLGNWSFGDYYKKEAISWAWELFTDRFKLPKEKLYATVYRTDDEALELWKSQTDINPQHVLRFDEKDNFWEMGATGPCGPCSEIHIDLGPEACDMKGIEGHVCGVNGDCGRYIELWNLVFIQYNRTENGDLEPLEHTHVDTGAGLERLVAVMQKKNSNYDTDLFTPIIDTLKKWSNKAYEGNDAVAMRVISDHIRTLTFALSDGITPSNEGRGYVIRRILRRAFRYGRNLGLKDAFLYKLVDVVVEVMQEAYPELPKAAKNIKKLVKIEEERFSQTLEKGLELFEKVLSGLSDKTFPGEKAFTLYDTYGFPIDLTALLCREKGYTLDQKAFNDEMEKQKELARKSAKFTTDLKDIDWKIISDEESSFVGYEKTEAETKILKYNTDDKNQAAFIIKETPFYAESGGQVSDTGIIEGKKFKITVENVQKIGSEHVHFGKLEGDLDEKSTVTAKIDLAPRLATQKNHTATHLLHKALRTVLGDHVQQKGSLVDPEKLRFDFAHFEKVSQEQIEKVEELVNQEIQKAISVYTSVQSIEDAKKMGAMALFGEKYGDTVRVVEVKDFSIELCGGTHVSNIGEIGVFKIYSESSVASGIRRIEAFTAMNAFKALSKDYNIVQDITKSLNIEEAELAEKVIALNKELKKLKKSGATSPKAVQKTDFKAEKIGSLNFYFEILDSVSNPNQLKNLYDQLKGRDTHFVAVFLGTNSNKNFYVTALGSETKALKAKDIAKTINKILNGKGGGREHMAQGTFENNSEEAFKALKKALKEQLS